MPQPPSEPDKATLIKFAVVGAAGIAATGVVLYVWKKRSDAHRKATQDRQNLLYTHIPLMVLASLCLWMLFFKAPQYYNKIGFEDSGMTIQESQQQMSESPGLLSWLTSEKLGSAVTDNIKEEAESIASHRPSRRKFVLGFISGLSSVLLLRNMFFNGVVNKDIWYFFT